MVSVEKHFVTVERGEVGLQDNSPTVYGTNNQLLIDKPELLVHTPHGIRKDTDISNEFFHSQLKPLLSAMRIAGLLPIKMPTRGKYTFITIF
jgi:hypothetical protein